MQSLTGVRVIELAHVLAGPYCGMVLADMGADVIKIERYPNGDMTRRTPPIHDGESHSYAMVNRNKKGMRLNLETEEGREILYRLVKDADVLIENYRPGVTKRLGIDYETLSKLNPELIYCSISGYGQTGPYKHKGGFDIMAQGMSGIMSMTGEKGGRPVKVGVPIHDIGSGITAVYHILLAYIHRMRTGEGQHIDISLVESCLAWTVWEAANYFDSGKIPVPNGSRHRNIAPYQSFCTKTDYILIGAPNGRLWERFCQNVVKKEEWLEDPRFATGPDRVNNIDELEKLIEEILVEQPVEYWLEKLEAEGIPCCPILSYDQVMQNEHILARDMVLEYEHPVLGKMRTLGFPGKMSKTPGKLTRPAPTLGEHTDEIIKELNFSEEEIQYMKENSIL